MNYYFFSLAIHGSLTLLMLILVVITSNRNKRGKVRRGAFYFLPLIFAAVLVFQMFHFTAPRLLDVANASEENFLILSGVIEDTSALNNYIVVDGQKYFVSPRYDYPAEGTMVRIRYLRYSHCVVSLEEVEQNLEILEEN